MSDVLCDLARAKAIFQLRAIEAIINAPASVDRSPEGQDPEEGLDAKHESAVPPAAADAHPIEE